MTKRARPWGAATRPLRLLCRACLPAAITLISAPSTAVGEDSTIVGSVDAERLAGQVMIYRDQYGVPHVVGETDESTIFGFGYAQAEDDFWQVEDSYLLALGRYCEAHGPRGLNSDLLNRAFEIVPRSQRDFPALDAASRRMSAAFTAGINHYLATHPEVRPRLLTRFEPWFVLAFHRHMALELSFRLTGLSNEYLPRRNPHVWTSVGSNGWALSGRRTASGHAMLLAAPHMPWYGFAQLAEAHLLSKDRRRGKGWNFIGAHFRGSPVVALGHNERLAWTLVSNKPDVADLWRLEFSHPDDPLAFRYDGAWRQAEEWTDSVRVRKARGVQVREFTFRKTQHGPIVAKDKNGDLLAARISGLFESVPMRQSLRMMRAQNLDEFRTAIAAMQIIFMNVLYADCDGNILFIYMGNVPRRNPNYAWSQPVAGSDPATQWLGVHALDELPQVLNPAAGFLQNCNSTPLAVTDGDNPVLEEFPAYMIGDADVRNRRSLRSLQMLRGMQNVQWDDWIAAAFDTQVYWAQDELPEFAQELEKLEADNPQLVARVRPYLEHLLGWDARITDDSTAASLCHAWYEQLYGHGYPGETLREPYRDNPAAQLSALVKAAERLEAMYGKWRMPYGQIHRIQRKSMVADLSSLRFSDRAPSLPLSAGHGPMGVVYTAYYTPSVDIPMVISQQRRYAVAGTSYTGAYELDPNGVRGASVAALGASGHPKSPHFWDQGELLSERRMKPEYFTEEQVVRHAAQSYRPGQAP